MNNQDVICTTRNKGSDCSGLLITLEPQDNFDKVLKELLDPNVRTIDRGSENGNEKIYIELNPDFISPN